MMKLGGSRFTSSYAQAENEVPSTHITGNNILGLVAGYAGIAHKKGNKKSRYQRTGPVQIGNNFVLNSVIIRVSQELA